MHSADTTRWILHVDMDAYYASIEQRDRPELRGRPVVVGGSPASRSVVCAASYEARRFGVRSAMACAQARRLCPDAVFVEPDFTRYSAEARRIRALFSEVAERIEPLSLDEAHLDISAAVAGGADPGDLAAGLRRRIRSVTGLAASAGVAANKFLAKAASDRAKPDGQLVVAPAAVAGFVAALPIEAIPGIGPVTARRCHDLGLVRAVDLLRLDAAQLLLHFGSSGAWFAACARGEDDRPVVNDRERRSVGIEDTFARDLSDRGELLERLRALADGLAARLSAAGVRARTLTLKVTWHDFTRATRSRTFPEPVAHAADLVRAADGLLARTAAGRVPIRLLGLSCRHLDRMGAQQQTWF